MIKQVLFFATKGDLLPVLDAVEGAGALKYVRMGNFTRPELDTFSRGADIPKLGEADADSASSCEAFLVCTANKQIEVRSLTGTHDIRRYCVDQLLNPDTVTFSAGGQWNDDILLYGRVATVSGSPASQALMKRFRSAIRKHFVKVRAFYVGPNARSLLEAGKRLTIAAQSPREFDLAP